MPLDQQGYNYEAAQVEETKPTLPDKLSELILVALADLEKAETSPLYRINMSIWHDPNPSSLLDSSDFDDKCFICFAGGVMAFSLNAPNNRKVSPNSWGGETCQRLYALNNVRVGLVQDALEYMGVTDAEWPNEMNQTAMYGISTTDFKSDMRDLASRLATAGY